MLRTSSLLGAVNSGFVPFSSAAPSDALVEAEVVEPHSIEADAAAEAAEVVARAAAAPAFEALAHRPITTWAPASSARIGAVEGAVIVALCAYFGYALLRTLAGI